MAVYVELQKDELDEYQQSKFNVLSAYQQTNINKTESKKHAILLTLVLLINTIVMILVAYNKISKNMNESVIKNEDNSYQNELSNLFDRKLLSDYASDITNTQPIIELNDSTIETNYQYMSSEFTDQTEIISNEISQDQTDD